jgi:hypothetical protein
MCLWHHPSHHHHHPPFSFHSLDDLGDNIDSQRNSVTIYLGLKRRYLLLKQDQMSQEQQLTLGPGIRHVLLIVRDHLVTSLNSFGLWRDYPERPTFDPDSSLTLEDLATPRHNSHLSIPPMPDDPPHSPSIRAGSARPTYWPFPNPTIHGVMKWLNNGKTVKSEAEMTHFVRDVILSPEFEAADLIGFDAHRENQ